MCLYEGVSLFVCVCVCVCGRERDTHMYTRGPPGRVRGRAHGTPVGVSSHL